MVSGIPDATAPARPDRACRELIVTGDFGDAEQTGAVGAAMPLREPPLMGQERRALHEKHREGRHSNVAHAKVVFLPRRLAGNRSKQPRSDPSREFERTQARHEPHSRVLENPLL